MMVEQDPLDSDGHKFESANLTKAKMVGGKYGFLSGVFGIFLAYLIGIFLFGGRSNSLFWLVHTDVVTLIPVTAAGVALLLAGFYLGRLLAVAIADKPGNARLFGTLVGLITLLACTLTGTMTLVVEIAILEGVFIFDVLTDSFIFIPGSLIFITGALPAIVMGIWLGKKVEAALETE